MASSATAEQLLISALLNTSDVKAAATFGLTTEYIEGYPAEYKWLLNYVDVYGDQPTKEAFLTAFPSFRLVEHENVRFAVDMVFKAFGRRALTAAMTEAYDALEYGDPHLAFETIMAKGQPRSTRAEPRRLLTDMTFMDDWDAPMRSVEVPYPTLQRHTKGLQPGNLWYLAARPGQGKTAHLVNIVKHAVLSANRVRFFSLEMSEAEVRARFHAALATQYGYADITLNSLRDRSVDKHTYKTFLGELQDKLAGAGGDLHIHTPKDGPVSPGVVAAGADEYDLTVIDYVGLMKADGGHAAVDDWRMAAKISNSLKEIGLSASTGILSASQINRDGETGSLPPKVKNLSQSDALGQDGDVVVTLRSAPHNAGTLFSLEKNRHGCSAIPFQTLFDPNRGIFTEVSAEYLDHLILDAEASL